MKTKKIIPLVILSVLMILGIASIKIFSIYARAEENENKINDNHIQKDKLLDSQLESKEKEELDISENIEEEIPNDKVEELKEEISSPTKKEETKENNIDSQPKATTEPKKPATSEAEKKDTNNQELSAPTNPSNPTNPGQTGNQEKTICSDSDPGWNAWLTNYKNLNPYSKLFATNLDSVAYGEFASHLGYGYWYDVRPSTYNGENCTRSVYMTMLYIPKDICVDANNEKNKEFYIPATEKEDLMDIITYLKNKGYDCGTKK